MAGMHRIQDNILVKHSFLLTVTAAAVNGTGVDTLGYRRAAAIFDATPTGAGTTSDCKLQDSPDNSTFTDVTTNGSSPGFAQATTAGGNTHQILDIDLAKRQRYLRLVETGAGASAAGASAGLFLLYQPWSAAPTQDNTASAV